MHLYSKSYTVSNIANSRIFYLYCVCQFYLRKCEYARKFTDLSYYNLNWNRIFCTLLQISNTKCIPFSAHFVKLIYMYLDDTYLCFMNIEIWIKDKWIFYVKSRYSVRFFFTSTDRKDHVKYIKFYHKLFIFPIVNFQIVSIKLSSAPAYGFTFHDSYIILRLVPNSVISWT